MIHSLRLSGPIFRSSSRAKVGASGVCVMLGRSTRKVIHGTTRHDSKPGTIAAMNQLGAVTWTPVSFRARLAPSRLLAWPVMNIAHATAEP